MLVRLSSGWVSSTSASSNSKESSRLKLIIMDGYLGGKILVTDSIITQSVVNNRHVFEIN